MKFGHYFSGYDSLLTIHGNVFLRCRPKFRGEQKQFYTLYNAQLNPDELRHAEHGVQRGRLITTMKTTVVLGLNIYRAQQTFSAHVISFTMNRGRNEFTD